MTKFRCVAIGLLCSSSVSLGLYACKSSDSSLPEDNYDFDSGTAAEGGYDGSTSSETGPTSNATPEQACAAIAGEQAKVFSTCCNAADLAAEPAHTWSGLDSLNATLCVAYVKRAYAAGRVTFDDGKLKSCLDTNVARYAPPAGCNYALDTSEEALIIGDPAPIAACDGVVVGKGDINAPCGAPMECKPGLTCLGYRVDLLPDAGLVIREGTCRTPPVQGAACGPVEADGGPGKSSAGSTPAHPECTNGWCAAGACAAPALTGQACAGDPTCATGLTCHDGVCGDAGRSGVNGDCKDGRHDCRFGLRCNRPSDGGLGVCVAKAEAGAQCTGGPVNSDTNVCKGRCGADAGATGQCVSYCGSN